MGAVITNNLNREDLARVFAIDLRALAAFRIGIGLALILHFVWEFNPETREFLSSVDSVTARNSMLVGALFLSSIALTTGFYTRIATVCTWVCLYLVLHPGTMPVIDFGLRLASLLLLWGVFLPLGEVWSLDSVRRSKRYAESDNVRLLSYATVGILFQLCLIYIVTALLKEPFDYFVDKSSLFYALSYSPRTTAVGRELLHYPELLSLGSVLVIPFELLFPFFILNPRNSDRSRILLALSFMIFHLGLAVCMRLHTFPLICVVAWMLFLPSSVWNAIEHRAREKTVVNVDFAGRGHVFSKCLLVVMIGINILHLTVAETNRFGAAIFRTAAYFGVEQYWQMYNHPRLLPFDWFVVSGVSEGGDERELITNQPITWELPYDLATHPKRRLWHAQLLSAIVDKKPEQLKVFFDARCKDDAGFSPAHVRIYRVSRTFSSVPGAEQFRSVLEREYNCPPT